MLEEVTYNKVSVKKFVVGDFNAKKARGNEHKREHKRGKFGLIDRNGNGNSLTGLCRLHISSIEALFYERKITIGGHTHRQR